MSREDTNYDPRALRDLLPELLDATDPAFIVWAWEDAPECLQETSPHGGDEDWVVVVPPKFKEEWVPWVESGSLGACCTSKLVFTDDYTLLIGAHA